MDISMLLPLIAVVLASLYVAWGWVRTQHLVPVLGRALLQIYEEFDAPFEWPVSAGIAALRLRAIRQYQGRLWVLGDGEPGLRQVWREKLARMEQKYVRIIDVEVDAVRETA